MVAVMRRLPGVRVAVSPRIHQARAHSDALQLRCPHHAARVPRPRASHWLHVDFLQGAVEVPAHNQAGPLRACLQCLLIRPLKPGWALRGFVRRIHSHRCHLLAPRRCPGYPE